MIRKIHCFLFLVLPTASSLVLFSSFFFFLVHPAPRFIPPISDESTLCLVVNLPIIKKALIFHKRLQTAPALGTNSELNTSPVLGRASASYISMGQEKLFATPKYVASNWPGQLSKTGSHSLQCCYILSQLQKHKMRHFFAPEVKATWCLTTSYVLRYVETYIPARLMGIYGFKNPGCS